MLKIKELRLEKNLTQKELALKISSTNKNIWAYESGLATPPADVLIRLAQFFCVSVDYILGVEDDFGQKSYDATPVVSRLTEKEERLLDAFRNLTDIEQDKLIDDAEFYANRRGASTYTAIKK